MLILSAYSASSAQQATCNVLVTVSTPDPAAVPRIYAGTRQVYPDSESMDDAMWWWGNWVPPPRIDLPPEAFVVSNKKRPIRLISARPDRGPRRIIFVAENGPQMTPASREIEAAVISNILSKARPEDSFALLTARGPRVELRFASTRDAIQAAAENLQKPAQDAPSGEGVMDALLEAYTWFQPLQPGDSVFLTTLMLESKHKAKFPKVQAAALTHRIRVFAFQLGSFDRGGYGCGDNLDRLAPPESGCYNDQAPNLSLESGGEAILENTEAKNYQVSDQRLRQLKASAGLMYATITKFYAVQLDSIDKDFVIHLSPQFQKQFPAALLIYPRHPPACSNTSGLARTKIKSP
jgi:hypothetical protein